MNWAINDGAVSDIESGPDGEISESAAAKVNALELQVTSWIRRCATVAERTRTRPFGDATRRSNAPGRGRVIPPTKPYVRSHGSRNPMIGQIENGRCAQALQSQEQGFGEPTHVPDVNEVGTMAVDDGPESTIVIHFQTRKGARPKPGMPIQSVNS